MSFTLWIGILASAGTSLSLLPQLIKLFRERKAEDLSVVMLAVLSTGLTLWVYYGIRIEDWIIISANSIALLITLATIILVVRYRN